MQAEASNGLGLENNLSRYRLLGIGEVEVIRNDAQFEVDCH
jgi:hypothetical protein